MSGRPNEEEVLCIRGERESLINLWEEIKLIVHCASPLTLIISE